MTPSVPLSIIVPTYREAGNIRALVARVSDAMRATGQAYELIIVDDDSRDGTVEIVNELASQYPLQLIVRTDNRDLSLAVVDGLRAARGEYLVVMDADLSHPPEQIPDLLAPLRDGRADFVIGSRYVEGGSTHDWGGSRRVNSYVATALAWPLSKGIRDVMAGFFALKRETFEQATSLRPIGYKIGLELLWRCRCEKPLEVPIRFEDRKAGVSKLNLEQQARYLIHLDRLYREYARGWSIVMRPTIWCMLGAIRFLQYLRRRRT